MNYLKQIAGILFFVFLTACFGPPQVTPEPAPPLSPRTDREYEDRIRRDTDREDVIRRGRTTRFSGRTCDEESRSHKCRDICGDIYHSRQGRDDCEEEFTAEYIERLEEEIYEVLESPDDDDLNNIDLEDFEQYVNLDISGFERLVGRYSSREAEDMLAWLIAEPEAARVFEKEDDDFEVLEDLLKRFTGSFGSSDIYDPFLDNVGRDKLMELLISDADEDTMQWFVDFINEKNTHCEDDTEDIDCFAIYCKIGDDIDSDSSEDWLDFEVFEDYLDDIIDAKVNSEADTNKPSNGGGWCHVDDVEDTSVSECPADNPEDETFEDVGDLGDSWVDDLCEGLTDGSAS